MVLPLSEVVLRRFFSTGVPGAAPSRRISRSIVGLVGAPSRRAKASCSRSRRARFCREGRPRHVARSLAAFVGALVTTILALGGVRLLQVHYETAKEIAIGVPIWVADLAFPVAFGLIALRLVWKCSTSKRGSRARAGSGSPQAGGSRSIRKFCSTSRRGPGWPCSSGAAMLGMPIYALIGGAAVILFLIQGDSPANAIIGSYDQLTSTDLPAIPLFTLAGFLLAEGHASDRLLRLFRAFFGWTPGGTAVVTAMLCAFFTLLTGGSGVTILALGGLLLPALLADGYSERFSLGLLTAAGSLGLLFPPSLPLILYGIVAEVPIGDLFVGGFLPGMLMLGALAALGVREGLVTGSAQTPIHGSRGRGRDLVGEMGTGATGRDHRVARRRRNDGAVRSPGGAVHARRAAVRPSRPDRVRRPATRDQPFDRARRRHSDHSGGRGRIDDLPDRRAGARTARRMGTERTFSRSGCSCSA